MPKLPNHRELNWTFLQLVDAGKVTSFAQAKARLARKFQLSKKQLNKLQNNGANDWSQRVRWSQGYLEHAKLIVNKKRGQRYRITKRGHLLCLCWERLDDKSLCIFPEFAKWIKQQ